MTATDIATACLQAYVDKDREALEKLVSEDFRFTSPLDNGLNRQTYFARCWPNSVAMQSAQVLHAADADDRAFIVYEVDTGQKRIRNCELHTVRDGQLIAVEVYFGWNLPLPPPWATLSIRQAGRRPSRRITADLQPAACILCGH